MCSMVWTTVCLSSAAQAADGLPRVEATKIVIPTASYANKSMTAANRHLMVVRRIEFCRKRWVRWLAFCGPLGEWKMAQKEILKSHAACRIVTSMMTHATTTAGNAKKVAQLQSILAELLAEALRRGFFGTARVELSVQDGTIQHIRRLVERIDK